MEVKVHKTQSRPGKTKRFEGVVGKLSVSPRTPVRRTLAALEEKGLVYRPKQGVDDFLQRFKRATPDQLVQMEREGIAGIFLTDLSKRMDLPSTRVYEILRIPRATAARKNTAGAVIDGRAGLAAINMIKLLSIAQDVVDDSTAPEAENFDTLKWLGWWIEQPSHRWADASRPSTWTHPLASSLSAACWAPFAVGPTFEALAHWHGNPYVPGRRPQRRWRRQRTGALE